jgi:hypothetical protein
VGAGTLLCENLHGALSALCYNGPPAAVAVSAHDDTPLHLVPLALLLLLVLPQRDLLAGSAGVQRSVKERAAGLVTRGDGASGG